MNLHQLKRRIEALERRYGIGLEPCVIVITRRDDGQIKSALVHENGQSRILYGEEAEQWCAKHPENT